MVLNKGDIMARQNQGINVKVPRVKVIKALEQSLVKLENNSTRIKKQKIKSINSLYDKWQNK
jgi:hypothetical protein